MKQSEGECKGVLTDSKKEFFALDIILWLNYLNFFFWLNALMSSPRCILIQDEIFYLYCKINTFFLKLDHLSNTIKEVKGKTI